MARISRPTEGPPLRKLPEESAIVLLGAVLEVERLPEGRGLEQDPVPLAAREDEAPESNHAVADRAARFVEDDEVHVIPAAHLLEIPEEIQRGVAAPVPRGIEEDGDVDVAERALGARRVGPVYERVLDLLARDSHGDRLGDTLVSGTRCGGCSHEITLFRSSAQVGCVQEDPAVLEFACDHFVPGDFDASGLVEIDSWRFVDVPLLFRCLFQGATPIACKKAADLDDDRQIRITDAVYLLRYFFLGGEPPPEPSQSCGLDPAPDGLEERLSPKWTCR